MSKGTLVTFFTATEAVETCRTWHFRSRASLAVVSRSTISGECGTLGAILPHRAQLWDHGRLLVAEVAPRAIVAPCRDDAPLVNDGTFVVGTLSWSVSTRFAGTLQVGIFGAVIARVAQVRRVIANTFFITRCSFGAFSARLQTRLLFSFIVGSFGALFGLEFSGGTIVPNWAIVQIGRVHANDAIVACDALDAIVVRFCTRSRIFTRFARGWQLGAFGAIIARRAQTVRIVG